MVAAACPTPSAASAPPVYREVALPQGTLRYREAGEGPTLVFVHGIVANSTLWRNVIPLLCGSFHCIAPDLPLGSHAYPMRPDADQSPIGWPTCSLPLSTRWTCAMSRSSAKTRAGRSAR